MNTKTLDAIEHDLRTKMPIKPGPATVSPVTGNTAWKCNFGDGLFGIVKVGDAARHGVHAPAAFAASDEGYWIVARALGWPELAPTTVARPWPLMKDAPMASVQLLLPPSFIVNPALAAAAAPTPIGLRIAVIDFITHTGDRNWGNVMLDQAGNIVAIDNQFAFARWGSYGFQSGFWATHQNAALPPDVVLALREFVDGPPERLISTIGGFATAATIERAHALLARGSLPPMP